MVNKELLNGIAITFLGLVLLSFGLVVWLFGRNIYGSDASLIFAGGMLALMAINGLSEYYISLFRHIKNKKKKLKGAKK